MNLQLVSPFKICPYKCPFCMAKGIEENSFSDDFYFQNKKEYLSKLVKIVEENDIKTIVFTGSTEPTLFPKWIEDCSEILKEKCPAVKREIQTRNYTYSNSDFDVVAFSIYQKLKTFPLINNVINRYVFIYNKELTIDDIINIRKNNKEVQLTVKILVSSSWNTSDVNEWIKENKKVFSSKEIEILKENNVRYDEDCSIATGRYIIYRCDGNIYNSWSEKKKN